MPGLEERSDRPRPEDPSRHRQDARQEHLPQGEGQEQDRDALAVRPRGQRPVAPVGTPSAHLLSRLRPTCRSDRGEPVCLGATVATATPYLLPHPVIDRDHYWDWHGAVFVKIVVAFFHSHSALFLLQDLMLPEKCNPNYGYF